MPCTVCSHTTPSALLAYSQSLWHWVNCIQKGFSLKRFRYRASTCLIMFLACQKHGSLLIALHIHHPCKKPPDMHARCLSPCLTVQPHCARPFPCRHTHFIMNRILGTSYVIMHILDRVKMDCYPQLIYKCVTISSPDTTHIPFAHRNLHTNFCCNSYRNGLQTDLATCSL